MRVRDGLPGSFAYVDADVVTIRPAGGFDRRPSSRKKCPDSGLFCNRECQEVGLVAPRSYEAVAATQRKAVLENDRELVARDKRSRGRPEAESTWHRAAR